MEKNRKEQELQVENNNIVCINPIILVITLNISYLATPIKSQRLSEQIRKQDSTICCLQETHFKQKHIRIKNKRRKIYHDNTNQKREFQTEKTSKQGNYHK